MMFNPSSKFSPFGKPSVTFVAEKSAEPDVIEEIDYSSTGVYTGATPKVVKRRKYLPGEKLLKDLNKTRKKQKNKHVNSAIEDILRDLEL